MNRGVYMEFYGRIEGVGLAHLDYWDGRKRCPVASWEIFVVAAF